MAGKRKANAPAAGHGGRHERYKLSQSTAASSSQGEREPAKSKFADHLLRRWAWGEISANEVQQVAMSAYADQVELLRSLQMSEDLAHPVILNLARLGNWGETAG